MPFENISLTLNPGPSHNLKLPVFYLNKHGFGTKSFWKGCCFIGLVIFEVFVKIGSMILQGPCYSLDCPGRVIS